MPKLRSEQEKQDEKDRIYRERKIQKIMESGATRTEAAMLFDNLMNAARKQQCATLEAAFNNPNFLAGLDQLMKLNAGASHA